MMSIFGLGVKQQYYMPLYSHMFPRRTFPYMEFPSAACIPPHYLPYLLECCWNSAGMLLEFCWDAAGILLEGY